MRKVKKEVKLQLEQVERLPKIHKHKVRWCLQKNT